MPRVRRVIDVDDAVKRYAAGESTEKIAKFFGCCAETIIKNLIESGVRIRGRNEAPRSRRITLDDSEIARRYASGESELSIANDLGVSRNVIARRIAASDLPRRGRSAAMFTRMAKTTEAERLRLTEAAHDAVRGKPQSFEHRVKIATGRQRLRSLDRRSPIEVAISKMLADRGVPHTRNAAVGPYNVDFSLDPVRIAVEVFGGGWHAGGAYANRFFKRTKYLLDRGWDVVIVWVDPKKFPPGPGVVDQIISSTDFRRAYPSARSQYRVLLGNGDPATARRSYFNDAASVQRLRGGENRRP